ncbi:MAG: hypothetical protein LBO72_04525 [Helicobacteraceae bacterium]|jgi:4-hydroxybenzoate polyprenyltransferase|nr:hypothetical protein [Helicobacteraceae bacterium]
MKRFLQSAAFSFATACAAIIGNFARLEYETLFAIGGFCFTTACGAINDDFAKI